MKAVDSISFDVRHGEILALVGESGCGKTTAGRCIVRAIEPSAGSIHVNIDGVGYEMSELSAPKLKAVRRHIGMIFQDPYSSLNPRLNVMEIVGEPLVNYGAESSRKKIEERVAELLTSVKLDPIYMLRYPHSFSGGQRQRVAIARALALNPRFVVADEPVSALDVSVQAQILTLLRDLRDAHDLTYLFVSHNLSVVEYISDRILVMYAGKIVEFGETHALFQNPLHPYTEALLSAVPRVDTRSRNQKRRIVLKGEVADVSNLPSGCHFHPRCSYAEEICRTEAPPLVDFSTTGVASHLVACHFANRLSLEGVPLMPPTEKFFIGDERTGAARGRKPSTLSIQNPSDKTIN